MTSRSPLARSGISNVAVKTGVFQAHFGRTISETKMLLTGQKMVAATLPLHHRDQRLILHNICHFQPFLKFQLSNNFSCSPPFAKMPKISDFLGLGFQRLRCVPSIVSGAKQPFLKCLIRTFIPSNFD